MVAQGFQQKYGPWALVAGASEGVGREYAEQLAARGLDVVLLARRQEVLDEVAASIRAASGVQTRTLAVDLQPYGAVAFQATYATVIAQRPRRRQRRADGVGGPQRELQVGQHALAAYAGRQPRCALLLQIASVPAQAHAGPEYLQK